MRKCNYPYGCDEPKAIASNYCSLHPPVEINGQTTYGYTKESVMGKNMTKTGEIIIFACCTIMTIMFVAAHFLSK